MNGLLEYILFKDVYVNLPPIQRDRLGQQDKSNKRKVNEIRDEPIERGFFRWQ